MSQSAAAVCSSGAPVQKRNLALISAQIISIVGVVLAIIAIIVLKSTSLHFFGLHGSWELIAVSLSAFIIPLLIMLITRVFLKIVGCLKRKKDVVPEVVPEVSLEERIAIANAKLKEALEKLKSLKQPVQTTVEALQRSMASILDPDFSGSFEKAFAMSQWTADELQANIEIDKLYETVRTCINDIDIHCLQALRNVNEDAEDQCDVIHHALYWFLYNVLIDLNTAHLAYELDGMGNVLRDSCSSSIPNRVIERYCDTKVRDIVRFGRVSEKKSVSILKHFCGIVQICALRPTYTHEATLVRLSSAVQLKKSAKAVQKEALDVLQNDLDKVIDFLSNIRPLELPVSSK